MPPPLPSHAHLAARLPTGRMDVSTFRNNDRAPNAATPIRVRTLQPSRNRYRLRLPALKRADIGVVFKIAYARTPTDGAFGDHYYLRLKTRC